MKCPYCGEEMKQGFISGDRFSLKWVPEDYY
ncbi:PF20097 family protein [Clostridium mobile]|nr:PF20097 family protein [Clostridium mobile]